MRVYYRAYIGYRMRVYCRDYIGYIMGGIL